MKKTRKFTIWPLNKGLDLTSIPGTQQPSSLVRANNIVLGTIPSCRKRPGLRRIQYIGNDSGTQASTQMFAVSGGAKVSEVVRVRNGRFEALRDLSGGDPHFVDVRVEDDEGNLSDVNASTTDSVTFEQFSNALIIGFENRSPLIYRLGQNLREYTVRSTHLNTPPSFFRKHDYRMFYGGVENDRDRIFVSAPNNIFSYTLLNGGFGIRVNDGDNDPEGVTGISETFRGDLYIYKWGAIYRLYRAGYGYGLDQITNEAGAVSHKCIASTQNDVYSVDTGGIRSLAVTDKYGAAEETTLTWPIYEYFQENVNWSAYKNFKLTYDKPTATLLFLYTSAGSTVNDRILGMNLRSKEFFEWVDCDYSDVGRYYEFGRQKTFVHSEINGACILDKDINTLGNSPINLDIETGKVFPFGDPRIQFNLTQAWLLARPTTKDVEIDIEISIDGKQPFTRTVNTFGTGYGAMIDSGESGGIIGTDLIGRMPRDLAILPFDVAGDGHSVSFRVRQEPTDYDIDQPCELYGIVYEIEYNEDDSVNVTI